MSGPMLLARRPIALFAAYVFALQMLLLPLGLAALGLSVWMLRRTYRAQRR